MEESESTPNPRSEHYCSLMGYPLNFEFPQRHWGFTIYELGSDGKIIQDASPDGKHKWPRKAYQSKHEYGKEEFTRRAAEKKIAQLERQRLAVRTC